jgi:hypothetical protein
MMPTFVDPVVSTSLEESADVIGKKTGEDPVLGEYPLKHPELLNEPIPVIEERSVDMTKSPGQNSLSRI